MQHNSIVLAKS